MQLADSIDCALSALVYWESDIQEPGITMLKRLCHVLEVSADYLLGLSEQNHWGNFVL